MENMLIINSLCPSKKRLAFDIFTKNQIKDLQKSMMNIVAIASEKRTLAQKNTTIRTNKWAPKTMQKVVQTSIEFKLPLHADVYNQLQVQGERFVKYMAMISLLELASFKFAAKVARYDE